MKRGKCLPKEGNSMPMNERAIAGDRPTGSKKAVIGRIFRYYMRYKWRVLLAFVLMVGSNLFALLGPWLSGAGIDAIDLESGVDFAAVGFYCLWMAVFVLCGLLRIFLPIVRTYDPFESKYRARNAAGSV